jgi:hypothetical protein
MDLLLQGLRKSFDVPATSTYFMRIVHLSESVEDAMQEIESRKQEAIPFAEEILIAVLQKAAGGRTFAKAEQVIQWYKRTFPRASMSERVASTLAAIIKTPDSKLWDTTKVLNRIQELTGVPPLGSV